MYIGAEVFSSILCKRLFKTVNLHGVQYQFVSSPGVVCQDGLFMLKTTLHARRNHNLPTYVGFVDLVKDNTLDHRMMVGILERYGAPPKLRSAIARMNADLKIVSKIGKAKA